MAVPERDVAALKSRADPAEERQELKLSEAAQTLLDECRMVLPGIQAIFGFQLIAVFNNRFGDDLEAGEQILHLAAIVMVGIAAGLLMTPAAIHRFRGARCVTASFIGVSSVLVVAAMPLLAAGLCLDVYLIARMILDQARAWPIAAALFALMVFLWTVFPRMQSAQRRIARLFTR